jgi:hypothetical protein
MRYNLYIPHTQLVSNFITEVVIPSAAGDLVFPDQYTTGDFVLNLPSSCQRGDSLHKGVLRSHHKEKGGRV